MTVPARSSGNAWIGAFADDSGSPVASEETRLTTPTRARRQGEQSSRWTSISVRSAPRTVPPTNASSLFSLKQGIRGLSDYGQGLGARPAAARGVWYERRIMPKGTGKGGEEAL